MKAFRSGMLALAVLALCTGALAAHQSSPTDSQDEPPAQLPPIVLPAPPASSPMPSTSPKSSPPPPAPADASKPEAPPISHSPSPADDAPFMVPPGSFPDKAAPNPPSAAATVPPPHLHSTRKSGLDFWSPERELEMGKELDSQMLQQVRLLDDPFITGYLEEITARIARNSDVEVPVVLRVVESSVPDSFSLPGGYIYITLGMVRETRSEAELAAVIAHEVAHIACRHATRQMTRQQMYGLLSLPLMFIGGPVAFFAAEGVSFAYPFSMLKFSRNAENEADVVGVGYINAAGYDPHAAISLFERIASQEKLNMVGLRRLFSTHPITRDRVTSVARAIAKLPPNDEVVVTTSRYDEITARLSRMGYNHDPGVPALIRRTGRHQAAP